MSEQQMTNNELAELLIKAMEGIAAVGAAQADTNTLIGQLAEAVAALMADVHAIVESQAKLIEQCQRAIDQVVWREQAP